MSSPALDDRGLPAGYPFRPDLELTPRQASDGLAAGRLVLIDVRTPEEREAAQIPGSIHVPLHELQERADEIDAGAGGAVAVICHHGARSMKGALMLRALGFPAARSVAGGIDLWSIAVDPSIPRYTQVGPRLAPPGQHG